MNKSLRSFQEEAPNWSELDRNTLPQLHQILRELGSVPPANADRTKLLNLIRYRLSPKRTSFKGKLANRPIPREPSAPQLFNVLSDHESSGYSGDESMGSQDFEPVVPTPSRLFPAPDRRSPTPERRSPPLSVRLPAARRKPARNFPWRAAAAVAAVFVLLALFVSDSCGHGLASVGGHCVPAERASEYKLALAAAKYAHAASPELSELLSRFAGVNVSLLLGEPEIFGVGLVDGRVERI